MNFRLSMFVDAFRGSGVPVAGDPITSFQNVPLLGLRTGTVLNNCKPRVGEVVKVRFLATNCGPRPVEMRSSRSSVECRTTSTSEDNLLTLLPGESFDYSVFRSWDGAGEHQLTMAFEARWAGQSFARLVYPSIAIHVRPEEPYQLKDSIKSVLAGRSFACACFQDILS